MITFHSIGTRSLIFYLKDFLFFKHPRDDLELTYLTVMSQLRHSRYLNLSKKHSSNGPEVASNTTPVQIKKANSLYDLDFYLFRSRATTDRFREDGVSMQPYTSPSCAPFTVSPSVWLSSHLSQMNTVDGKYRHPLRHCLCLFETRCW